MRGSKGAWMPRTVMRILWTDVGEVFGVWVIEGDEKLNDVLPFKKAGLMDKVFVVLI